MLDTLIPARGGQNDGHLVIDLLCQHPATPQFLATKLVRRFVTDDPLGQTPDLVARVADAYQRTDGDIKEMLSTILRSREFAQSFASTAAGCRGRWTWWRATLRAVDYQPGAGRQGVQAFSDRFGRINTYLAAMGHIPFYWPTPDGYPDVKEAWLASSVTLTRWNMGLSLCGVGEQGALFPGFSPTTPADLQTAGDAADYWIDQLLHRPMLPEDRSHVVSYLANGGGDDTPLASVRGRLPFAVALILDSPYFQRR